MWCWGHDKENDTDLIRIQGVDLIWLYGCWSDFNKSEGPSAKGQLETACRFML